MSPRPTPPGPCLPLGRALALIGGLALLAAYFMPWFGMTTAQGSGSLTGDSLGRFLATATPNDLRRVLPGFGSDPNQLLGLRALVALFPACGALAALLAIVGTLTRRFRIALNVLLAIVGLVPLVAVVAGLSLLPAGASSQVGLQIIGAGAVLMLVGVAVDVLLVRDAPAADREEATTAS